jgi:hypothetical protein
MRISIIVEETADKVSEVQDSAAPFRFLSVTDGENCRFGTPRMEFGGEGERGEPVLSPCVAVRRRGLRTRPASQGEQEFRDVM